MAISKDAISNGTQTGLGSSISWTHTCAAGAILIVGGHSHGGTGNVFTATYNSVAMTAINHASTSDDTWMFYMLAPATGANTVQVTSNNLVGAMYGGAISLLGANTSSQPETGSAIGSGTSSTPSQSETTTLNNAWQVCVYTGQTAKGINSSNANQFTVYHTVGSSTYAMDYKGPITPAGPSSMGFTLAGTDGFDIVVASFKPAAAVVSTAQFMPFFPLGW